MKVVKTLAWMSAVSLLVAVVILIIAYFQKDTVLTVLGTIVALVQFAATIIGLANSK